MTGRAALPLSRIVEVLRRADLLLEVRGSEDVAVSGVAQDSRRVSPGDLFLAWKGTVHDGHDFVASAGRSGAVAAVVEGWVEGVPLPQLRVADGRRAAALAAMAVAGDPARAMFVAAVTGTNGKTTTTLLVRHLLQEGRGPAVALGTLGVVGPDGVVREGTGGLTTPGPVELARALEDLAAEGTATLALEASSHALEQRRLDGLHVDVACFTNLTRDHLDYHGTEAAYLAAKARLLELLVTGGTAVVNGADPAWTRLPPVRGALRVVGVEGDAAAGVPAAEERLPDLVARDLELGGRGTRFALVEGGEAAQVEVPLVGRFNVENVLCAAGVGRAAGLPLDAIAGTLSDAPIPVGRLEVTVAEPVPVILDYAHTPDALARVLEALRPLYQGRLIVVFGAGGERDRAKRPLMGRAATRGADFAIVTSDNPRTEDPDGIVDEIVAGMEGDDFERITDRRSAIRRALEIAREGDAVLLAGKGHETYQDVGGEKQPFDERRIVREILDSGRAA